VVVFLKNPSLSNLVVRETRPALLMMNGSVSLRDGPASVVAQWGPDERLIGGAYRVRYRVGVDTAVVPSLLR